MNPAEGDLLSIVASTACTFGNTVRHGTTGYVLSGCNMFIKHRVQYTVELKMHIAMPMKGLRRKDIAMKNKCWYQK